MLGDTVEVHHFDVTDPGDGHPFSQGDLRDAAAVERACAGMDAVVHIAALHGPAWRAAGDDIGFEVNVIGTKNVLAAAVKHGVKRVVFTSSIWATGHGSGAPYLPIDEELPREPAELYGLTKAIGEKMCRYYSAMHGISTIVLRPGGIRRAENYDRRSVAYLTVAVDVRDVAAAHKLALEAPLEMQHEVFIVTADSPLARLSGDNFTKAPASALEQVMPGAKKAIEAGTIDVAAIREWYTIEKARRMLGYEPRYNFGIE